MSFSTNPHLQYHAPGSKEDIELNKSAITNFKPVKQFALKSENAFDYCTALKNASIQFGYYGILTRIATDGTIAAPADGGVEDPTDVTLSNFTNMLTSWDSVDSKSIQKNATMVWGNKTWTETDDKEIVSLSVARGEVTAGGKLNVVGQKIFMKRKKLIWLAHHVIELIIVNDRDMINVEEASFLWIDSISGDIVKDGLTIAHLIFSKLRPNVRIDIYKELKLLKEKTLPKDVDYDMIKWLATMQRKRNQLNAKSRDAYPIDDWINDVLTTARDVPNKKYADKIESIKQDWDLDEIILTETDLVRKLDKLYNNNKDSWKLELQKTDQIVILTTKLKDLEAKISKQSSNTNTNGSYPKGNGQHYTVKPWRLEYKGEKVEVGGRIWNFCRGDHWSGGIKYNGMYCQHKTEEHDAWRKEMDAEKQKNGYSSEVKVIEGPKTDETPSASKEETLKAAKTLKLGLSDSLQAALTTQVGITPDHWRSVWEEACEESGN